MFPRILIVDDNVYLLQLLRGMLEDEGFEVATACHAEDGYAAYLRNRPEMILTDIHMPGGSGLEMVARIRRRDPYIPAIYMSGDWAKLQTVLEEEKRKWLVRSLRKPFSQNELMKVLAEVLAMGGTSLPAGGRSFAGPGKTAERFCPSS